jgi:putative hydrolase
MRIEVDTHTHTVLCGHAFSTVEENARFAKKVRLKGFTVTEHGPAMKNCPEAYHINTLITVPDYLYGVRVYKGVEANILDYEGNIDIAPKYLVKLDFAIASLHDAVMDPGTQAQNTNALIAVLNDPMIDCIGHPGNPIFPIDQLAVVKEAARKGKILEVNNHSFEYRTGSRPFCNTLIGLCAEYGVRMAISSDSHFCRTLGNYEKAYDAMKEMRFPESLIINLTKKRFEAYLEERKVRITAAR